MDQLSGRVPLREGLLYMNLQIGDHVRERREGQQGEGERSKERKERKEKEQSRAGVSICTTMLPSLLAAV